MWQKTNKRQVHSPILGLPSEYKVACMFSRWMEPELAGKLLSPYVQMMFGARQIIAIPGSRLVFEFPDTVRLLLVRGEALGVSEAVTERLLVSACGRCYTYSEGRLDPESQHLGTQAEALAHRYRDDPLLGAFYRGVVEHKPRAVLGFRLQ